MKLKRAYGDRGVPKDTWDELEAICKEAAADLARSHLREPPDA